MVLDVDGTLVDSERDGHRLAFNRAFEEASLSTAGTCSATASCLAVTGGVRRLNAHFEEQGRLREEREEPSARLHARKTEIITEMAANGEIEERSGVGELDELEEMGCAWSKGLAGNAAR